MEADTSTYTKKIQNPFPGLRAFRPDESYLFFGRSTQVQEVAKKLVKHRFVSVIGPSGIGKSSFIYCGLFPSIKNENPADNQLEWKISTLQPGEAPLQHLLQALDIDQECTQYDEMKAELKEDFEAEPQNKLIFIDQFEELFRFESLHKSNHQASEQFVQLLLDLAAQQDVPIYIVITMRSDFIGNCSRYPRFTQKINDSQFLIPFMTEEEKKQAITGPVKFMGVDIDDDLVEKVLKDVEEIPEQLPLMQHALMRTWNEWQKNRNRDTGLKIYHYDEIGGIKEALSVHANEAYNELPPEQRNTCAKIFRSITEITNDGRRIRRPAQLREIAHEVNASEEDIISIVEPFRRKDRGLLMPSEEETLQGDSIIDISHESLIRVWNTLHTWVEQESESVKLYLRLAEDAEKHQKGQAGLWTNPDLEIALDWRNKQKPTKAWGIRYHPTFDRTMWFLQSSKEAHDQQLINKEQKRIRDRRTSILVLRLITAALVFAIVLSGVALQLWGKAEKESDRAEANRVKAQIALDSAEVNRVKAVTALDSAEVNRVKAVTALKSAEANRVKAVLEAKKAELEKTKAKTAEDQAIKEAKIAQVSKQLAEVEKQLAQIAREEADELRLLSIASSMAIKSKDLTDKQQKALVAQQAYKFHERSKGDPNNPDIYTGLYYALKSIEEDDYAQFKGHTANVRGLVSLQGTLVYSAGSDGKIILWDSQSREVKESIEQDSIHRALAISPKKSWLACVGNYPGVQLFKNGELKMPPKKINLDKSVGQIWFVTFLDEQRIVFADESGNINLGNTQDHSSLILQSEGKGAITSIASAQGTIAYAVGSQVFLLTGDYTEKQAFPTDDLGSIISLAISDDGRFLALGDAFGTVQVYQISNRSLRGVALKGHNARVNQIAFSKDGNRLATGSFDQTVRIWNIKEPKDFDRPPIILEDHNDWVWSITFNDKGNLLLAGCRDKLVRAWPTDLKSMSSRICPALDRNMSRKEWERFVATLQVDEKKEGEAESIIYYEKTCENYKEGVGITEKDLSPKKK